MACFLRHRGLSPVVSAAVAEEVQLAVKEGGDDLVAARRAGAGDPV